MSQYFPKPNEPFGGDINVKLDLSNYPTKADIKNISHVHTWSFALKSNLTSVKTEIDKLDIDKLAPASVDWSKLNNVVTNDVVKKAVYDKLVAKVNIVNTSGFVLKTNYDVGKSDLEKKIADIFPKFPKFVGLLKRQITMLKLLKQRVKCQVLVV